MWDVCSCRNKAKCVFPVLFIDCRTFYRGHNSLKDGSNDPPPQHGQEGGKHRARASVTAPVGPGKTSSCPNLSFFLSCFFSGKRPT